MMRANNQHIKIMTKFKYFKITARLVGEMETLYGSYDKAEAEYELEAMRDSWKDEGYRGIQLKCWFVDEAPDEGIYGKAFIAKQAPKVSHNVQRIQRQLGASLLPW
tara:strand:+ start:117 stop:434 length:318 start_codon:yes stop_codon:yes gene_type:complete